MQAARMHGYGEALRLEEVRDPEVTPDGVVLAVRACGVCGSDLHAWRGDWRWRMELALPHTLGHEIAGEVIAVGEQVERHAVGDLVTLPFHLDCGACPECAAGRSNRCESYTAIGFGIPGGFAERVAVPAADRNLVALPAGVDPVTASMLGCRSSSAWHGLVDVAELRAGEQVVVFGLGGVGSACIAIARARGASVIGVDPNASNRELAEALGAERTVATADELDTATFGLSVDAVGADGVLAAAVGVLARGGRHLQLGLTSGSEGRQPLPVDDLVKQEKRVLGAVGCPRASWDALLSAVAAGDLGLEQLPRRELDLDQAAAVLQAMAAGSHRGVAVITP